MAADWSLAEEQRRMATIHFSVTVVATVAAPFERVSGDP